MNNAIFYQDQQIVKWLQGGFSLLLAQFPVGIFLNAGDVMKLRRVMPLIPFFAIFTKLFNQSCKNLKDQRVKIWK